jgi:hypothetical protein
MTPLRILVQRHTAESLNEFSGETRIPEVDGRNPENTWANVKPSKGTLGFSRFTVSLRFSSSSIFLESSSTFGSLELGFQMIFLTNC